MNRFVATLLVLGMACTTSAKESSGEAGCIEVKLNTDCEIEWDFSSSTNSILRGTNYQVQVFSATSGSWKGLDQRKTYSAKDQRLGGVGQGKLYRVVACDASACKSSDAVWAIDWTNVEDMPDIVIYKIGGETRYNSVSKSGGGNPNDPVLVRAQYNMYLVEKELVAFLESDAEIPSMPKPTGRPKRAEDIIQYNVYDIYQAGRKEILARRGR